MKAKLFKIFLSLAIVLTIQPVTAFAEEAEQQTAQNQAQDQAQNQSQSQEVTPSPPASEEPLKRASNFAASVSLVNKASLFKRHFYWEAGETVNFETANDDGSLSVWQKNWYITHDWSEYGKVIATLESGDAITVNGKTYLILGRRQWPKGTINYDVYNSIGWDKAVFQTCYGSSSLWIAYGIRVRPSQQFLDSHGG